MMLVANAFCLCDHRNINLSGLGVMARDAQHCAVLQAVVATKRGRDDVIEMLLMIDGNPQRSPVGRMPSHSPSARFMASRMVDLLNSSRLILLPTLPDRGT